MTNAMESPQDPAAELEVLIERLMDDIGTIREPFELQIYLSGAAYFMAIATLWQRYGGNKSEYYEPSRSLGRASAEIEYTDDGYCIHTPDGLLRLPNTHYPEIRYALKLVEHPEAVQRVFPRAAVVSMVSAFEAHVGRLARFVMRHKPSALRESKRQMSFADLLSLDTIDDAKEVLMSAEVEDLLRDSHTKQLVWFDKHLRSRLEFGPALLGRFVEVTQRRHLFVHTDGVVSKQYLISCAKLGAPPNIQLGQPIETPMEYIAGAGDTLIEAGIVLAQTVWRDLLDDQHEEADTHLIDEVILELLVDDRHQAAAALSRFALGLPESLTQGRNRQTTLIYQLNLAQALKWAGDDDGCQEIVAGIDWSGVADHLEIGLHVLLDDDAAVLDCMRRMGSTGAIEPEQYEGWPIFKRVRGTEAFRTTFEEIFGRPPVASEAPPDPDLKALNDTVLQWMVRLVEAEQSEAPQDEE